MFFLIKIVLYCGCNFVVFFCYLKMYCRFWGWFSGVKVKFAYFILVARGL